MDFDVNTRLIDHFSVTVPNTGALLLVGTYDRVELELSHPICVHKIEIKLRDKRHDSLVIVIS